MRIELRGVRKRFDGHEALAGIDLVIEPGERVALIGPNGSGKSTLLRAIMGMLKTEGTVRIDGRCPFRDREAIAHRLAYVPQIAPQLGATVSEIMRAIALLRGGNGTGLRAIAGALALDLSACHDKAFRSLSGGMKQKLLLALALSSGPSLLILDEPTASLDAVARERFASLLEAVPRTTTVLLCTHREGDLQRHVDRVVELDAGRLARDLSILSRPETEARSSGVLYGEFA